MQIAMASTYLFRHRSHPGGHPRGGSTKGLSLCQSLLRALLGQKVNLLILEKAQTLPLDLLSKTQSSTTK
jgi:hypothetical protein